MNPLNAKYLTSEQADQRTKDIVTVGRLSRVKNQKMMIEAINQIKERYPEYTLKIYGTDIGEGTEESLNVLIEQYELQDKVKLMGNSDTLEKDIVNAAMFLLTSDYEGMPNALMEAMAMGIPCIATDCPCGGSKYLLTRDNAGILVGMNDYAGLAEQMVYIIEHETDALEMGKRAQYVKEEMHPDKIYQQWKIYLEGMLH